MPVNGSWPRPAVPAAEDAEAEAEGETALAGAATTLVASGVAEAAGAEADSCRLPMSFAVTWSGGGASMVVLPSEGSLEAGGDWGAVGAGAAGVTGAASTALPGSVMTCGGPMVVGV